MGFFKKLKARLFTLDVDKIMQKDQQKSSATANLTKNITTENKTIGHQTINSDQDVTQKKYDLVHKKQLIIERKIAQQTLKERKRDNKLNKYIAGLSKSNFSFSQTIKELQSKHNEIDQNFFNELEEALIMSDISYKLVTNIIYEIKREVKVEQIKDIKLIGEIIADKIFTIYTNQSIVDTTLNIKHGQKNVILIVGVNGSGKTTTIGKLAAQLVAENYKVLIAAADTFRAGAVSQLAVWAQRVNVRLVKPQKEHADPGSVVFDAMNILNNEDYDVLIIDTAGRLQNKVNLMNELRKIYQIIGKKLSGAPQESLLVLDATTGQNGILQAKQFQEISHLTGIILTKMDGTSKGGIILTIKDELALVVKFLGFGEQIDDLQEFDLDAFIYGMTRGLINETE